MKQVITAPSQLGHLCASARKSLARSQAVQATKLGVTQSRLSKMELHPETMTLAQVLTLCSSLGLELIVASREQPSPSPGKVEPGDSPW